MPQANAGILVDGRTRGVPDLIVEILSPNNAVYDRQVKLVAYAMAGVPEYAIVDPRTRTLEHYRLYSPGRYNGPTLIGETGSVCFDCLPSITVQVGSLFAGAPDTSL